MNTPVQSTLPALGSFIQGGYFHGIVLLDGVLYGEVTAANDQGEVIDTPWHPKYPDVPGAVSVFDGLANTQAMAAAGSPLAKDALGRSIEGFNDWYLPAYGSLMLQWGNLRPLKDARVRFRDRSYWSSTQYSRHLAFRQYFGNGSTTADRKDWEGGCARFVRRFALESLNP